MNAAYKFEGTQEQYDAIVKQNQILAIAKVCHQANKAWCESEGDFSQKDWGEAEQWQRDSSINGVKFRLENPGAGPDAQHNAWSAEKVSQGWVYGGVRS